MKFTIQFLVFSCTCLLIACTNNTEPSNNNITTTDSTTTITDTIISTTEDYAPIKVTGTYLWGDQESEQGGGYLVVEQQENDSLKFELGITNGAPGYHSGSATGMMALKDNVAIFTTSEFSEENPCKIIFTFKNNAINVIQEKGSDFSCGFGQGVIASGFYTKEKEEAIFKYEGGF